MIVTCGQSMPPICTNSGNMAAFLDVYRQFLRINTTLARLVKGMWVTEWFYHSHITLTKMREIRTQLFLRHLILVMKRQVLMSTTQFICKVHCLNVILFHLLLPPKLNPRVP